MVKQSLRGGSPHEELPNPLASLLPRGDAKSERALGVAYLRRAVLGVMNYLRVVFSITIIHGVITITRYDCHFLSTYINSL